MFLESLKYNKVLLVTKKSIYRRITYFLC